MAPFTLNDLSLIITGYLPQFLSVRRAFYFLEMLPQMRFLFTLNHLQHQETGQRGPTGWARSIQSILSDAFAPETWGGPGSEVWDEDGNSLALNVRQRLISDAETVSDLMEEDVGLQNMGNTSKHLVTHPPFILMCNFERCIFPSCLEQNQAPVLRREAENRVRVIGPNYLEMNAYLMISACPKCDAHYLPHAVTFLDPCPCDRLRRLRLQRLLPNPEWFCVSRNGFYVHRDIAKLQHGAIKSFKATWMGFRIFFNDTFHHGEEVLNDEQVHHLFADYFTRLLLLAHNRLDSFTTTAFASGEQLIKDTLKIIGEDGGIVPAAIEHQCPECTHPKRYPGGAVSADGLIVRAAVMDGKTLTHRICRIDGCHKPLANYRDGVFCEEHIYYNQRCGIAMCNLLRKDGSKACHLLYHQQWYQAYVGRFGCATFAAVSRVIRRTAFREREVAVGDRNRSSAQTTSAFVHAEPRLPPLQQADGQMIDGGAVQHYFRAGSIYCVQTIQWACGTPIGWGKCYSSESVSQVMSFLNRMFPENQQQDRPSFIFYDNACRLLAHIGANGALHGAWLNTTRFIVDAFHYINHSVQDHLCRDWCNPAPENDIQPDLVITQETPTGETKTVRAFNSETAEQLNAWLSGFEGPMRQMTNFNFDFFMHVLMFIYKERCDKKMAAELSGDVGNGEGGDLTI